MLTSDRMRASFLITVLLISASALQGCTVLTAIETVDRNQKRRTEARTTGPDTAARPPTPGDTVAVSLADGRTLRDTVVSLSADSLRLSSETVALADIDVVERPWRRSDRFPAFLVSLAVDAAVIAFLWDSLWL